MKTQNENLSHPRTSSGMKFKIKINRSTVHPNKLGKESHSTANEQNTQFTKENYLLEKCPKMQGMA